ncbi:DUF1471 domain-containing protein [Erwinia sp. S43]|uniref:YdgH/BhsA/McbA-like domain containing protein n=1 Tax=unclassified Erwinia TaxID=2622719 RepID=UPI0019092C12|nr:MULTISPECIES: YdgH/BhsA/McbA-like domain containing protein [unclassified Erwinia]MBK0003100.1 DUF1471 domain-containing protein [Erwinia sp. S38]MBK0033430.1 DUF1471 domain-containing protein [Erwinia sp. S43]MCW1874340.1 DUF1471 domain-containing protein [Erwinia sp. INIA01]
MKKIISVTALLFTATLAFNASAAEEISRQQVQEMNLDKIGVITTTGTNAPMDAKADLSAKADKLGGRYYVIIAAEERGRTLAEAEVYK